MPKYFRNNGNVWKIRERKQTLFCNIYKLHNSYFIIFVLSINVVILVLFYFYIYIYYTCRSLTREGLLESPLRRFPPLLFSRGHWRGSGIPPHQGSGSIRSRCPAAPESRHSLWYIKEKW